MLSEQDSEWPTELWGIMKYSRKWTYSKHITTIHHIFLTRFLDKNCSQCKCLFLTCGTLTEQQLNITIFPDRSSIYVFQCYISIVFVVSAFCYFPKLLNQDKWSLKSSSRTTPKNWFWYKTLAFVFFRVKLPSVSSHLPLVVLGGRDLHDDIVGRRQGMQHTSLEDRQCSQLPKRDKHEF